jgi:membrane protease YdiL (CAAX protease family)
MPFTVLGALIGAVFIAPFCEEIFFRGFLFAGLLRGMTVLWAMLLSTALFTIVHTDLGSAVPLFAIGLMLAVIRWRTGSIWPGMALHMLNNAIASVLVIATILGAAPH